MTYNVFGGTLNPTLLLLIFTLTFNLHICLNHMYSCYIINNYCIAFIIIIITHDR